MALEADGETFTPGAVWNFLSAIAFDWYRCRASAPRLKIRTQEGTMNGIIYIVGLIVVVLAVLSFFGLR